ncbi:disintegrin and metalloproteinase domain-containing protein 12-like [Carcharodon carcharias]|uniref:disintegrin and metalloproteinase domain-containing protein 12-like n=1 Tax=Carcharodon carcharias TaxID=13397 RepID=UPI001B7EE0A4|nr:disintegrin and metalloproteinase domain-containing protein 12-like [Carcharodon carcharias]
MEPLQLLILTLLLCLAPRGRCCSQSQKKRSIYSHTYEIAKARKLTEPLSLLSKNITKWELQSDQEDQVRYLLQFRGQDHVLHLVKARDLLTKTYSESHYLADGSMATEGRHHLNHCCYMGFIEGEEDSSVSLCTCQGLSGYILIGAQGYAIDPVEGSSHKHKVSRLEHIHTKRHVSLSPENLMSRNTNLSIELFLVADREEFLRNEGDLRKTQERLITLAHHVNQIYHKELNIQIFLVGIEIWTTENKISSSQDTSKALLNFMKWRSKELVPRKHHDNAQLISGVSFQKSIGQAYMNAMCSEERSGGVVMDTWASTREVAKYIAHEIGHNLGMYHDAPTCHCPVASGKCLLATSAVWMMNPVFSSCSKAYLEQFLKHHNISCLMNQPNCSMNITAALVHDDISMHYKIGAAASVSLLFIIIAGLVMVAFQKKGDPSTYHSFKGLSQQSPV